MADIPWSVPSLRRLALALCLGVATTSQAQIPDQFTNLQVLPKEISKGELIATMRGWTGALGVRCTHCHVGPDNLVGMDFATDDKAEKKAARQMLRMVQSINRDFLAALPAHEGPKATVTCYTCHRGQQVPPPPLRGLLTETALEKGAAAALERYRELRRDHPHDGSYDFSERTLTGVALALADAGRPDDALAVLAANAELYPQSPDIHGIAGTLQLRLGRRTEAEASFRKALAIDPNHPGAKQGLARLTEPPQP